VRVVEEHVHFTVLVALTLGELFTVELLMEHATPSTVVPVGCVALLASSEEQAEIPTSTHASDSE